MSRYKLQAQPLCELCLRAGKIEPATLVDHIVALEDGGELLPAIDGLMSMCISCHNMKHAGGIRGCDVDGMPLDPIASVDCAVMSSKNDNVMLAIEMSYLTSGQQSVYNAFLLD